MTTDRSDAGLQPTQSIGARRLRRRTSDRVVGGVAGGLGDYLNLDPVILRAGFAGLMIFGGAGLVLYVVGWLLIPAAGQDNSIAEMMIRRVANRSGRWGLAALVFLVLLLLSRSLTGYGGYFFIDPSLFWALAVAVVGVILLVGAGQPAATSGQLGTAPAYESATALTSQPSWAPAPVPAERSPLGWYVLAAVLLAIGALAIADTAGAAAVLPGQYFGAGLLAVGVGLLVGAWWGRGRPLILLGLAVLPVAATAAFVTVPLEGGLGDHEFRPHTIGELKPEYRLVGGELWLDLTSLDVGTRSIAIAASVGVGDLVVIVPGNARVEVAATVDAGRLSLFDSYHAGTGLTDRVEQPGRPSGPTLVMTLDAGIGSIEVVRQGQAGF